MRTAVRNGNLLDTARMEFFGEQTILIEDERIVAVGEDLPALSISTSTRAARMFFRAS